MLWAQTLSVVVEEALLEVREVSGKSSRRFPGPEFAGVVGEVVHQREPEIIMGQCGPAHGHETPAKALPVEAFEHRLGKVLGIPHAHAPTVNKDNDIGVLAGTGGHKVVFIVAGREKTAGRGNVGNTCDVNVLEHAAHVAQVQPRAGLSEDI